MSIDHEAERKAELKALLSDEPGKRSTLAEIQCELDLTLTHLAALVRKRDELAASLACIADAKLELAALLPTVPEAAPAEEKNSNA